MKQMKKIADFYVSHSAIIGFLLFLIPVAGVFVWLFISHPLRNVYLLRLALSIAVGGPVAALIHRYGINLWIIKHRSPKGPAGIIDGIAIGAGVGVLMSLIPPLFSFIQTETVEEVKTFVIISYLFAALVGGILGGIAAAIGRNYLPRK